MWYFAPGSKSSCDLTTGGDIPWYLHLKYIVVNKNEINYI
jgi:hypothetical protein